MDPLTAIGLAISAIKLGIEVYQAIHNHPSTTADVKAAAQRLIEGHTQQLAIAQSMYDTLQERAQREFQGA